MHGDRKKFCMSMMTSALLAGAMVMVEDVAWIGTRGYRGGEVAVGGCVRSKPDCSPQSQKEVLEPITARRDDILVRCFGIAGELVRG